jgi:hypothetical protein
MGAPQELRGLGVLAGEKRGGRELFQVVRREGRLAVYRGEQGIRFAPVTLTEGVAAVFQRFVHEIPTLGTPAP